MHIVSHASRPAGPRLALHLSWVLLNPGGCHAATPAAGAAPSCMACPGPLPAALPVIPQAWCDLPLNAAASCVGMVVCAGMVASMSPLPVIGVPVKGSSTDGMDSLLSIVQMPRGIPVATVAINNAANAGLLAIRIIASASPDSPLLQKYAPPPSSSTDRQTLAFPAVGAIAKGVYRSVNTPCTELATYQSEACCSSSGVACRMLEYQADLESMVLEKAEKLEGEGWERYLETMA